MSALLVAALLAASSVVTAAGAALLAASPAQDEPVQDEPSEQPPTDRPQQVWSDADEAAYLAGLLGPEAWCAALDAQGIECVLPAPAPVPARAVVPQAPAQPAPAGSGGGGVYGLIDAAAARHGVSAAWMHKIAHCESRHGSDPATYSRMAPHRGIYQFDRATWAEQAWRVGASSGWDAAFDDAANVELTAVLLARGQAWRWACR